MKPTDEQVEVGAQALRESRNVFGVGDPGPWDLAHEHSREAYRREARAVLESVLGTADSLSDHAMEKLHEWIAGDRGRWAQVQPDALGAPAADVLVRLHGDGLAVEDRDAILPMAVLGALDAFAAHGQEQDNA